MPGLPRSILLTECETGKAITAAIVELGPSLAKARIDSRWWNNQRLAGVDLRQEEDQHWPWAKLVQKWRYKPYAECVAIQTPDSAVQAAIIGLMNGKSLLESGQGAVIAERLATAPWNRDWLVEKPQYRGAGTGLLLFLVCHSYQLGFQGRISLFSLPIPGSEQFYRNRGFAETGETKADMIHFELPKVKALDWLQAEGML